MSNTRAKKRPRLQNTSYHDSVPLDDDFDEIHAREGRLIRIGDLVRTAPLPRTSLVTDSTWNALSSWTPPDDSNYALDSNESSYNEQLEADVMDEPMPAEKPIASSSYGTSRANLRNLTNRVWYSILHEPKVSSL